MGKQIVTVIGSTGAQGGGVVRALLDQQDWQVRAVTRNSRSRRHCAWQSWAVKLQRPI